jgi:hypothetical protein
MGSDFKAPDKITKKLILIGIHQVNGNISAIHFLQNADYKFVEGLFFMAKNYGRAQFEWTGDMYELIKNRNITYTVNRLTTEEEKEVKKA